jgi:hypothetical protein
MGDHKQGAAYGDTHTLGYHPLLATHADSGEVLHARQRTGRANTARGTTRFVDELADRVRRAGASGELTLRADSGSWSAKTIRACRRHQLRYSITVRQTKPIRTAIAAINRAKRTTRRGRSTPPRGSELLQCRAPATPGSRGLHAAERCAKRRSRGSRASVRGRNILE